MGRWIQPTTQPLMETRVANIRARYPRPVTADWSGSFSSFTSSQLAHEEEADAQRCERRKDDQEIQRTERKRDDDDDDFCLGSQELYNQSSSQSTVRSTHSPSPRTPRCISMPEEDTDSEWDTDAEGHRERPQRSMSSLDDRTSEEFLHDRKGVSCEKITLIHKVLYRHPLGDLSPDRKTFAKMLIAILYGLKDEDVDLIDKWIRRNKAQLGSWPFEV